MTKQYFIPDSVWAQVEAVEAASGKAVSPGTAGTWYAIAGTATAETLTTLAPSYNVSLGAIEVGQTVGAPGMGAEVEPVLEGTDGSPPGSYTWSATVNGVPAALPLKAADGMEIVLTLSDATHPLGAFSASSAPVTVATAVTVPAQMSAPSLVVDGSSQVTATLAADPYDGGSAITGHDLRHSTDEVSWTIMSGITSPHAITGLTAATPCYVQTRAMNAAGTGAWSASAKATTAASTLNAVSNASGTIDITVEDGTFTVTISGASHAHQNGTWGPYDTADLNSGPVNVVPANVIGNTGLGDILTAAPGVWVWDKANGTATTSAIWQRNEKDISGETKAIYTIALADDTGSIRYQETATDKAGSVLQASNAIPVTDFTEPAQMSAPSLAVISATEISVNRAAAPADGSADITQYDLRYSTDEVNWKIVTDISAAESITSLTASTLYYVQTRAMNIIGAGAWSASASATTNAAGALFEDDFTSQTLGTTLGSDSDWTLAHGNDLVKIRDIGGTRAAGTDLAVNSPLTRYTVDGTYPEDRKVTFGLETLRQPTGGAGSFYSNYVNSSNYTLVQFDANGAFYVRHRVAGSDVVSQNFSAGTLVNGDEIEIMWSSGSLSVKRNGSHVTNSPWAPSSIGAGQPSITWVGGTSDTTATTINFIRVENP